VPHSKHKTTSRLGIKELNRRQNRPGIAGFFKRYIDVGGIGVLAISCGLE
jgi:hypothetical protein